MRLQQHVRNGNDRAESLHGEGDLHLPVLVEELRKRGREVAVEVLGVVPHTHRCRVHLGRGVAFVPAVGEADGVPCDLQQLGRRRQRELLARPAMSTPTHSTHHTSMVASQHGSISAW